MSLHIAGQPPVASQSLPIVFPAPPSPRTPMTLANAAYLGIERFASDRNK